MARRFDASGDYRVLRRIDETSLNLTPVSDDEPTRVVVDVETEGIGSDHAVIELAARRFRFTYTGRITAVGKVRVWREDPGRPIDPAITRLTGLTDVDLAGSHPDCRAILRTASPPQRRHLCRLTAKTASSGAWPRGREVQRLGMRAKVESRWERKMQASACVSPLRFPKENTMNKQSPTSSGSSAATEDTSMPVVRENRIRRRPVRRGKEGQKVTCGAQVESRLERKMHACACVPPLRFPEEISMNKQSSEPPAGATLPTTNSPTVQRIAARARVKIGHRQARKDLAQSLLWATRRTIRPCAMPVKQTR